MTLETNKALARRAIDEVWSKGNVAVAPDIYASTFVSHQHSHPHVRDVRGVSALVEFVREFRDAFPDFHDTVDD
jgi:predicted SnoaL-like aldol condensation-catalyzing enzyme